MRGPLLLATLLAGAWACSSPARQAIAPGTPLPREGLQACTSELTVMAPETTGAPVAPTTVAGVTFVLPSAFDSTVAVSEAGTRFRSWWRRGVPRSPELTLAIGPGNGWQVFPGGTRWRSPDGAVHEPMCADCFTTDTACLVRQVGTWPQPLVLGRSGWGVGVGAYSVVPLPDGRWASLQAYAIDSATLAPLLPLLASLRVAPERPN